MKEPKSDVQYGKGHLHSHCGPTFHDDKFYCRFFNPPSSRGRLGTCDRVRGSIDPAYWCRLYEHKGS